MGLDFSEVTRSHAWDHVAHGYADFFREHLERYAADALSLAGMRARETVLDVATGPGTLARLAARTNPVTALDHSAEMITILREQASPEELSRLTLTVGDGQALPYPDDSFDLGFSMFGLFMFPDRARGFAELRRVVRPGGRAVVASWQPSQRTIPAFRIIAEEMVREMDAPPDENTNTAPLSDPEALKTEMLAAGFSSVTVSAASHTLHAPSTADLWRGLERAYVAFPIAKSQLPAEQYADLADRIVRRFQLELGDGPQPVTMAAWLALGR